MRGGSSIARNFIGEALLISSVWAEPVSLDFNIFDVICRLFIIRTGKSKIIELFCAYIFSSFDIQRSKLSSS
jgi:hypothetical protein